MEESRLDLRLPNEKRVQEVKRTAELLLKLNQTLPFSEEYQNLINELFLQGVGKDCYIVPPLYMNIASHLHIGNRVSINPYFRCMSASHIYIEDDVQIAMNVSIITNNHDFYDRAILTIKDVHIKKNAWIGAGAIILPGVTIGENAIVGAGSVVTHDVPTNTVVAGNPAKMVKELDPDKFQATKRS